MVHKLYSILAAPLLMLSPPSDPVYERRPRVTMQAHDHEVHQDLTQRELTVLRGPGTTAYTQAQFSMALSYELSEGVEPGHIVAALRASLNTPQQQVEIAKEYPPGSCEYRVLLAHELQHVQRNLEAMAWLKQEIEREESSKPARDFTGRTPAEVTTVLQAELEAALAKHYLMKYTEKRLRLNDPLDYASAREEEYRQCRNWVH